MFRLPFPFTRVGPVLCTGLILLAAVAPASALADDVIGCVAGFGSWWSVGDTLRFAGDCNISLPQACEVDCDCWPNQDCEQMAIDTCLWWESVSGVDLEDCSVEDVGASYGTRMEFCFWLGAGHPSGCIFCDEVNNYCGTIWVVQSYNSSPTEEELGCYRFRLVCGETDDCVGNASPDYTLECP